MSYRIVSYPLPFERSFRTFSMPRSPDRQVGDVNSSSAARIAATLQPGAWAPLCPVAGLFKAKGGGKPLVVSPGAGHGHGHGYVWSTMA